MSRKPQPQEKRLIDSQGCSEWWEARRLTYNIGLVVAGVLAFICYAFVLSSLGHHIQEVQRTREPPEITIFTIGFQGIGYLFMMGIANICYNLGPLAERSVQPENVNTFRKGVFLLGFWFSVLLPVTIPLTLFLTYQP